MRSTLLNSLLACALLGAPAIVMAQQPPAPAPSPSPAPAAQTAAPAQTAAQPAADAKERDAFSIGVFGWLGPAKVKLRKGDEFFSDRDGDLDFRDRKNRPIAGAVVTVPIKEHYLRFSYFQASNTGNTTIGKDLNIFAGDYDKDTYLATRYKIQNGKISFDYLSWPFPFEGRKFRIRTLWEVQYTNVKGGVDAPLKPVGEFESNAVESNKFLIWPSLGAAAEYRATKNFRLDLRGSGFALPKRPNLWDAQASAVVRMGKIELTIGGKGFHFRMSRKPENFFNGTMYGGFVGVAYRFE